MKPYVLGYDLLDQIGIGSFGVVYCAIPSNGTQLVAIKVEHSWQPGLSLRHEYEIYKDLEGGRGIPRVHLFQRYNRYNIMVIDLLGPSLDELFEECKPRFSLKTVLMLADQMLARLEYIHSKNIIHRDLKPGNFLMGTGRHCNELYLIDFGLAEKVRHSASSGDGACQKGGTMVGTVRYMSINAHVGAKQSPRDDLEAVGYILVYFLRGALPWQGLGNMNKKKRSEYIQKIKLSTPIKELCNGLPLEFFNYLSYCRSMDFNEAPLYSKIKRSFQKRFQQLGLKYDYVYDWDVDVRDDKEVKDNAVDTA